MPYVKILTHDLLLLHVQMICIYTMVHKKCATYFLNSFKKHWLILIIFGTWHQERTRCKQL